MKGKERIGVRARFGLLVATIIVVGSLATPGVAGAAVIAAAGDIACDPGWPAYNGGLGYPGSCRQQYTSDILVSTRVDRVLPLGDNQYSYGELTNYLQVYDPTWGRVRYKTRPAIGNHEGDGVGNDGSGHFDYFNGVGADTGPAGDRGKGYYSYNLGRWHLIALNSNCARGQGCTDALAQEQWLKEDLARPAECTLAYWHHPRFSSGRTGDDLNMQRIWQILYDAGAELVLSGHDHHYERFAPQNPSGQLDRANGVREFIVGTGGAGLFEMGTLKPNSEVRQNHTFGVLFLNLYGTSYRWWFRPEAGKTFTDRGSGRCHHAPPLPGG